MSFNALSLAKLGVGFGAVAVVTLGLTLGEVVEQPSLPPVSQVTVQTAGSADNDGGRGRVIKDHAWVKPTNAKRYTSQSFNGQNLATTQTVVHTQNFVAKHPVGDVSIRSTSRGATSRAQVLTGDITGDAKTYEAVHSTRYNCVNFDCAITTIDGDQIMALLILAEESI